MKYTALGVILTTVLVGGLAKFELDARASAPQFISEYTAPNNGKPDSKHGTGTRAVEDCRGGGRRDEKCTPTTMILATANGQGDKEPPHRGDSRRGIGE